MSFRFFMHTAKAVRANSAFTLAPSDRVLVTEEKDPDPRGFFVGWKMELCAGGIHFPSVNIVADSDKGVRQIIKKAEANGSEPTACFKPDSFYKEVTWNELMIASDKFKARLSTKRLSKTALSKLKPGTWIQIYWLDSPITTELFLGWHMNNGKPFSAQKGEVSFAAFNPTKMKRSNHAVHTQIRAILGKLVVPA